MALKSARRRWCLAAEGWQQHASQLLIYSCLSVLLAVKPEHVSWKTTTLASALQERKTLPRYSKSDVVEQYPGFCRRNEVLHAPTAKAIESADWDSPEVLSAIWCTSTYTCMLTNCRAHLQKRPWRVFWRASQHWEQTEPPECGILITKKRPLGLLVLTC